MISGQNYESEPDTHSVGGLDMSGARSVMPTSDNKAKEYSMIYKHTAKEVAKNDSGKYQTVGTASQ